MALSHPQLGASPSVPAFGTTPSVPGTPPLMFRTRYGTSVAEYQWRSTWYGSVTCGQFLDGPGARALFSVFCDFQDIGGGDGIGAVTPLAAGVG